MFNGFETGNAVYEMQATGQVALESTVVRTGSYAGKVTSSAAGAHFMLVNGLGTDYGVGMGIRFSELPALTYDLLEIWATTNESGFNAELTLRMNTTSGNLELLDDLDVVAGSTANPFAIDTWYFLEVYWQRSATGNASVFLRNDTTGVRTELITVTSKDFLSAEPNLNRTVMTKASNGTQIIYFDDYYCASGLTSKDDLYGNFKVSKAYQKTDGGATDVGSALTTGTWANASQLPGSDTNITVYSPGAEGGMTCDTGTRSGPAGDSNIASGSTFKGAKHVYRIRRTAGAGSTHKIGYGKNDTIAFQNQTLTTSYQNINLVNRDAVTMSADYLTVGFGTATGGAQDAECAELWSMVGYVPASGRKRFYIV